MTTDRRLERDTYWVARLIGYLVYAVVAITEIILLLGFVLRLFGANPGAPFTDWAYRNLDRAMAPFRGMFSEVEIGTTAQDVPAVLDVSILFAMIVYGIVAIALRALLDWLTGRIRRVDAADAWDRQVEAQRQAIAAAAPARTTVADAGVDITEPGPPRSGGAPTGSSSGAVPPRA